MDLFIDTSVWSLALRRDVSAAEPAVERLRDALETGEGVFTTGLVLQELLQGFHGPKARDAIVERFGLVVVDARYADLIELHLIEEHERDVAARKASLEAKWRARR